MKVSSNEYSFLFCFAKKVGKKGDTPTAAPSGSPKVVDAKREAQKLAFNEQAQLVAQVHVVTGTHIEVVFADAAAGEMAGARERGRTPRT